MKLIIGLGNPGEKYKNTRHNAGFIVTGNLAEKHGFTGKNEAKFNSIVAKGTIDGEEVVIAQPLTFMNLSGDAVVKIAHWYKIEPEDILVVFDDISLEIGRIRYRKDGSDGGHNGIKSIIKNFGGNNKFPRLKVGIGPQPKFMKSEDYVLQKFSKEETEEFEKISKLCIDSIETFLKFGIDKTMCDFNSNKK